MGFNYKNSKEIKAEQAKVAANQADSEATDVAGVVSDLNDLLAKLIAAGLMAES